MARVGTMVRDHMYDDSIAKLTAYASGTNRNLATPEKRLGKGKAELEILGKCSLVVIPHSLDAVHNVDGRGAAGLVDAHEHAAPAVGENDVRLRREAVAHVGHVLHANGCAMHCFDRQVVEFLNRLRAAIHLDVVFERTELGRAGGKNRKS